MNDWRRESRGVQLDLTCTRWQRRPLSTMNAPNLGDIQPEIGDLGQKERFRRVPLTLRGGRARQVLTVAVLPRRRALFAPSARSAPMR